MPHRDFNHAQLKCAIWARVLKNESCRGYSWNFECEIKADFQPQTCLLQKLTKPWEGNWGAS